MRFFAVVLAALAFSAAAFADAREAPTLDPAASYVAGKPVHVYCDASVSGGQTVPAQDLVRLNPLVCTTLTGRLAGRTIDQAMLAASLRVIVHESVHASGVSGEGETECMAISRVPAVASRFFGFKTWRSRHDLMALVWASHRTLPDAYRTVC